MIVRVMSSLVIALMFTGAVQAGDYEDGKAAYDRKDYIVVLARWRWAAEQGDARAQFEMGVWSERGGFVTRDSKEAVRWYQLAAQQGAENAQLRLGEMYELGQGVAQDYKEAMRCLVRSHQTIF